MDGSRLQIHQVVLKRLQTGINRALSHAGIGGANSGTLGFVEVALALHAFGRVDHIRGVALGDGVDRAGRFARATADAGVIDF
jgi:hypothetical protein